MHINFQKNKTISYEFQESIRYDFTNPQLWEDSPRIILGIRKYIHIHIYTNRHTHMHMYAYVQIYVICIHIHINV